MSVREANIVREDSKSMISKLHDLETETVLLTGDHTETANYFASKVGISKVYGNLLPEQKLEWMTTNTRALCTARPQTRRSWPVMPWTTAAAAGLCPDGPRWP